MSLVLTIVNNELEMCGGGGEGMSGKNHVPKHLLPEVSIIGRYRARQTSHPGLVHTYQSTHLLLCLELPSSVTLPTFLGSSRQMGTFYCSIDDQTITGYLGTGSKSAPSLSTPDSGQFGGMQSIFLVSSGSGVYRSCLLPATSPLFLVLTFSFTEMPPL